MRLRRHRDPRRAGRRVRGFTLPALALLLGLAPAWADKRLDEAVARAEAQLAKGKPAEAVKILQGAAGKARRDPEPQLALSRLFFRLGRIDEGEAALARAGELAAGAPPPVRARVFAERSGFALRSGTVPEAVGLAREAVAATASPESLAALARAQAKAGDPAARETAERAVAAGAGSAAAHLARGDASRAAWLGAEAESAYRRALELAPRSPSALAGLAIALAQQGKPGPALEAAQAAATADPGSAEAQVAIAFALLARDPKDESADAAAAAQRASGLEPRSALAKLAVGQVYERRDQLALALAAYEEAIGLDPGWGAPRLGALRVQLRQGDATGALAGLRALGEELGGSGEADLLQGEILTATDDPIGAEAALARAVAALPGRASAHAAHATAAHEAGDLTLAAEALGRAMAIEPGNVEYQARHARYLADDGRLDEAVAALGALGARPGGETPGVLLELGDVYRRFDPPRVKEAVAAYQRALELDPKSGAAAIGIARAYRAGRQWQRAADAYERVPAVDKRLEGEAMVGVAWCHLRAGDDYKARFYTGLAVRAGGDVGALRAALSGSAPAPPAELAELADDLDAKSAADQVRAARALLRLGRPAVPSLSRALGREGTSLAAREAIVAGLAKLGPAARDALPQLDRLAQAGPRAAPAASFAAAPIREREEKLVAAMQAAAAAIRGPR
jgi:Tfp pilus assembly protein PilF